MGPPARIRGGAQDMFGPDLHAMLDFHVSWRGNSRRVPVHREARPQVRRGPHLRRGGDAAVAGRAAPDPLARAGGGLKATEHFSSIKRIFGVSRCGEVRQVVKDKEMAMKASYAKYSLCRSKASHERPQRGWIA